MHGGKIVLKGRFDGIVLLSLRGFDVTKETLEEYKVQNMIVKSFNNKFYLTLIKRDDVYYYILDEFWEDYNKTRRQLGVGYYAGDNRILVNETDGGIAEIIFGDKIRINRIRSGEKPFIAVCYNAKLKQKIDA